MKPFKYRIVTEWSEEDKAFIARVPALASCAAHGKTAAEATREAMTAAEGILDSLAEHGDKVPPPDATAGYSGQLRLRLPRTLHEELSRLASAEGVSLNQELVALLAEGCGRRGVRIAAKTRRTEERPRAKAVQR